LGSNCLFISLFLLPIIFADGLFIVSYGGGAEHSLSKKEHQETSFLSQSIEIYQKFLSRSDGDRCPMYPSCSAYAKQAFHAHGLIKGWILTSDRLLRCGHDEIELSGRKIIKGKYKTPDPLDKNDFLFR
jgi:putative membrane protein insertion efficiency factor